MSNVKAGDLAIVVNAYVNEGRIVEVLEIAPTGTFDVDGCRYLNPNGSLAWIVKFIGGPGRQTPPGWPIRKGTRLAIYDSLLRRLPGDESTDELTTDREVTA